MAVRFNVKAEPTNRDILGEVQTKSPDLLWIPASQEGIPKRNAVAERQTSPGAMGKDRPSGRMPFAPARITDAQRRVGRRHARRVTVQKNILLPDPPTSRRDQARPSSGRGREGARQPERLRHRRRQNHRQRRTQNFFQERHTSASTVARHVQSISTSRSRSAMPLRAA